MIQTILRSLLWGFLVSLATAALSFLAFLFVMTASFILIHLHLSTGHWTILATAFALSTLVFAAFRYVHLHFLRSLQTSSPSGLS